MDMKHEAHLTANLAAALERDPITQALLERFGFDREQWLRQGSEMRVHTKGVRNPCQGTLAAPEPSDMVELGAAGDATGAGTGVPKFAAAILAGGMATRFGGVVKGLVEVRDGQNFLALKLAQLKAVARRGGTPLDVAIMTSFASHKPVSEWLASYPSDGLLAVHVFPQFISLRLTDSGELFLDSEGRVSPYAPGHGDFHFALERAGLRERLQKNGAEWLFVSNVDNLGAALTPELMATVAAVKDADLLFEVAPKAPGDAGGIPARLNGRPEVIEGFRLTPDFDGSAVRDFNTNTFCVRLESLTRPMSLDYFIAEKSVDDRRAIQFERLVGQLSAFLPTRFIRVPRAGGRSRFVPCKVPADLTTQAPLIEAVLAHTNALS